MCACASLLKKDMQTRTHPQSQLMSEIDYYFQAIQTSSAIFEWRQRLTVTPETNNGVAHHDVDDDDNDTHTPIDKCTHIDRIWRQKQEKKSIIHFH